jgi:metal-responsive CopG/Arc/MetJ family transcriptional regulator
VHKTTIYMPDDLRRALDAAARETGQSQADLIRRAVRAYLEERPQQLPASVGRHRGGTTFHARDDEARLESGWGARRGDGSA